MQAYRITSNNKFEGLRLQEESRPSPGPYDVLVKVHAVSLNFRDLIVAMGKYPFGVAPDVVPASDGACEIVEVGARVSGWAVGDRVSCNFDPAFIQGRAAPTTLTASLGGGIDGCLREYAVFPASGLVRIPEHLSYEEAATLPCAAVTAWNALTSDSNVPLLPGQDVVVQGTGGVSIFALQLARAAGANVIVTSSSDDKLEIARKLGATHTINYNKTPEWGAEVVRLTGGKGAEHIIEVGGEGTMPQTLKAIALGGSIAVIGFIAAASQSLPFTSFIGQLLERAASVQGIAVGSVARFTEMNRVFTSHKIKPVIDKVFDFKQAKEAYEYMLSQKHVGKVVIRVSQ